MSRFGLEVNVKTGNTFVDSDHGYLNARIGKAPPGIFKHAFTNNPISRPTFGITQTLNLLTVEHDLGYTPMCFCLGYVSAASTDGNSIPAGTYQHLQLQINTGTNLEQQIQHWVDERNFYLVYSYTNNDSGGTGMDVTGFAFTVKYYIFSNDGLLITKDFPENE